MKHYLLSDVDIKRITYANPEQELNETDYVVAGTKKNGQLHGHILGVIRQQASFHILTAPIPVKISYEGGFPLTSTDAYALREELTFIGYAEGASI